MVKGIMRGAVVINSSFLCCTLISSREFQQALSKQTGRLRSKGKPKVRPITVNIYSPITGYFQVSPWPPPPPLFFLSPPSFCPSFILPVRCQVRDSGRVSYQGNCHGNPTLTRYPTLPSSPPFPLRLPPNFNLRQRASECVNSSGGAGGRNSDTQEGAAVIGQ